MTDESPKSKLKTHSYGPYFCMEPFRRRVERDVNEVLDELLEELAEANIKIEGATPEEQRVIFTSIMAEVVCGFRWDEVADRMDEKEGEE